MSEVCQFFEEIAVSGSSLVYPNCQIGESVSQRCGPLCEMYKPQFGKAMMPAWERVTEDLGRIGH